MAASYVLTMKGQEKKQLNFHSLCLLSSNQYLFHSSGIDVDTVTLVVSFDLPLTPDRQADCEISTRMGRMDRYRESMRYYIHLVSSDLIHHILNMTNIYFIPQILM